MSKIRNLRELLIHELQDLYSAETQLVDALPEMAEAATAEDLKAAFDEHLDETEQHVVRIERVMEILGASPKGPTCAAMKGLIQEGKQAIEEVDDGATRDAAIIAAAQKVEHYEMAGYGSVRTFAELLGETEVAELLQATLDEEGTADKTLTSLSEALNPEAMHAASG